MTEDFSIDYRYGNADPAHTSRYVWEPVCRILESAPASRVFDLGCGNGAFTRHLSEKGFQVEGVDPSEEGIARALAADPSLSGSLHVGSAYEPLADRFGTYPWVVSLEVVEHAYSPRKFARCVADLLEPGGAAVISTPYHGYWKNLALALCGRMDSHYTALWDHGHIKFWSVATLTALFEEQGLKREKIVRAGRVPALAKSMILVFRKPRQ